MATLIEQLERALSEVGSRVEQVRDDQWADPTPCREWDVRRLVAHLVDEVRWLPYLLDGGTAADGAERFSDDPLGDDPKSAWRDRSASAVTAVTADRALDRTVGLSYGETAARDYVWELTCDLAVHAWDLARAIGADERLDPELVRRIHVSLDQGNEPLGSVPGLFDPPVPVPPHADLQTRVLGRYGRRA